MSDDGELISEFSKNAREVVRVRLTEYGGHKLIDVRAWYQDGEGGYKPGKGLSLQRSLIPELKKAIAAAERAAKDGAGP